MKSKKMFLLMMVFLFVVGFWACESAYADWLEQAKLLGTDGGLYFFFGRSVSISGDYAIVGADGAHIFTGSAYIFKRDGSSWSEQAKLTASDGAEWDYFGISVSISGDYAIVGAYADDDGEPYDYPHPGHYESGSAYIFKRSGSSWSQQAKLHGGWEEHEFFGRSVSMSGDYAIVGSSKRACIFYYNGTSWSRQDTLSAGAIGDYFGSPVSISGDYTIVGAFGDWDNGSESGAAYIFKRDGSSWSKQAKLLAADGAAGDWFGRSVYMSGDYSVVGSRGDDNHTGSAYIFKRDGSSWSEQAKLLAADGAAEDEFGYSVSISGDYAVVGAELDDDACPANPHCDSGSAYIFKRDGTGWSQQAKLLASGAAADDRFGCSVSISGAYAIVGAISGEDKGAAYIYSGLSDILGTKWHDIDRDGVRDAGELGLEGWRIYVDANENGQWDEGELAGITNEDGDYVISDIFPGSYVVREELQPGWVQTFPDGNGTHLVNVEPDLVNSGVDFGNCSTYIFVDADATGANNGRSWADAYKYLQDALAAAVSGNEIYVAEGIYKPDRGGGQTVWNRAATFQLINGVAIYGGFPSGGGDWSERDPSAYETILSGNIGWMWPTDNSYHVVTNSGTDGTAVLDGFTITAGNADGSYPDNMGGGMYNHTGSSPTIINCRLRGNAAYSAGAMFNLVSSPTLINCIIAGNSVQSAGGGMHSVNSNLTLVNCIFSGNQATHGGAMYNQGGTPTLTNCSLSGNTAGGEGGGIYNNNSDPILTNSILWGNSASGVYDEVGQIANNPGSTPVINYCCVQGWTGGLGGTGNIGDDPLFVDPPDNLRLLADSNCIDTGNNSAVPSDVTTDLDGHPRIVDGDCNDTVIVDMGAYEFNWAYIGDFDGDYDVDFADFAIFALACLTEPGDAQWNPDCDISIPADNYIDWSDLDVFSDNWLARARFSPIPNLLFSEYVEGSRSNQAVEIYNAGDVEVYLVNCYVRIYNNGSSSPVNTVHLNAVTLLPGEVFVLGHPGISVPSFCDQLSEYLSFNGNDAIELVYKRATHDVIGQIGFDPGPLGWGSRDTTTTDHTLRRKCSVSTGDRDGYDSFYPAVEWEAFPLDTFDGLGSHCQ